MKKEYMIISALIVCLFTIIIMGSIQDNSKKEKNDNKAEYVEKLEKENEKLNKQLEEINNRDCEKELKDVSISDEYHEKWLKEKQKIIEKLNGVLKNIESKDNEYQYIVDNVMDSFYKYAFTMHALPYCGEHANDIGYKETKEGAYSQYWESYTFKNRDEINNFFFGFLSENYYNNEIKKYYVEKDNKIYCFAPGKAGLKYEPSGSVFKIISSTEDKIEVYCIVKTYQLNSPRQIEGLATLIKENDSWVVDEYIEFY